MKRFEVYRNIRKKALIYGLPIGLFALMMLSIIGSLLVIIFSFSLGLIISIVVLNLSLYFFLTRLTRTVTQISVGISENDLKQKNLRPFL